MYSDLFITFKVLETFILFYLLILLLVNFIAFKLFRVSQNL